VVPFGFLDGFEVGRPSRSCRGQEGSVESVSLGGAEGGGISPPELRKELRPPGLGPESDPLNRGVVSQLGCYLVQVCLEPEV